MRNLLLMLFITLSLISYGQTEKGKIATGAAGEFSFTFTEGNNSTNSIFIMTGSPFALYFPVKNFAVGGKYLFTMQVQRIPGTFDIISGIGPMARYYFGKNAMKGFAHAEGGYVNFTRIFRGNTANRNGYFASAGLGIAYFLSDKVAIETMAAYTAQQYFTRKSEDFRIISERIGISVGVMLFLDPKKVKNKVEDKAP